MNFAFMDRIDQISAHQKVTAWCGYWALDLQSGDMVVVLSLQISLPYFGSKFSHLLCNGA
jgi:hypothetical protein